MAPSAVLAVVLRITRPRPQRPLLLAAVVWICGWLAVYLPFSWVVEYHLLPFAFGAAAFSGVVAGDAANYQLVRFISALLKGSVVGVNLPSPSEYVTEIGMHVRETEGRPGATWRRW